MIDLLSIGWEGFVFTRLTNCESQYFKSIENNKTCCAIRPISIQVEQRIEIKIAPHVQCGVACVKIVGRVEILVKIWIQITDVV